MGFITSCDSDDAVIDISDSKCGDGDDDNDNGDDDDDFDDK